MRERRADPPPGGRHRRARLGSAPLPVPVRTEGRSVGRPDRARCAEPAPLPLITPDNGRGASAGGGGAAPSATEGRWGGRGGGVCREALTNGRGAVTGRARPAALRGPRGQPAEADQAESGEGERGCPAHGGGAVRRGEE